ncbi:MAG TPA: hypothetical protein G4O02_07240 [Caldilineae bacterium]|nr:hypothetical protein [Caldilineae bacterium]
MYLMKRPAGISLRRWGGWLLPLCLFLILSLYQLSLPGLHYDEAREAGVNAMQLLQGLPVDLFRGAAIRLGRYAFPLMVQDYIGALNVYLAVPLLAAGGINVVALRLLPVLTAAATIVLTHRLAHRLGGTVAAWTAALLLAIDPSFVFWSRQGIFVTNMTALLAVAAITMTWRLARNGRRGEWIALGFLCGLGIWSKLLFIWVIGAGVAAGLAILLVYRWDRGPSFAYTLRGRLKGVDGALAVGGLLLGMAPLLIFNVQTGGTWITLFSNLGRSYYGVHNADFLHNLARRIVQLGVLLRGEHFWYLGTVASHRMAPWLMAMLVALAFAAWSVRSPRHPGTIAPLIGGIVFVALYVAQSSFTVSDLFVTHYATLLPFMMVTAGLAAGIVVRNAGRPGALAVLALVLSWAAGDLVVDVRYHRALAVTGGHSSHSDAIYELAEYLDGEADSPIVALDWGMDAPVQFLTAGRVDPVELFGYERLDAPDPGFQGRLAPYLAQPGTLYLFHPPEDTVFRGRWEALEALARNNGHRLVVERVIRERTHRPLFVIARVVPVTPRARVAPRPPLVAVLRSAPGTSGATGPPGYSAR